MKLTPVIAHLREHCPRFETRVAGAARFEILPEATALGVPCAFVVPLTDDPDDPDADNGVGQALAESFAVFVAVSNAQDERGQASSDEMHDVRAELWAALLGWRPTTAYGLIRYEGSALVSLDRARMWTRFEFAADTAIGPEDGWQQRAQAQLPTFQGVDIRVDVADPIANPRPGPDGRIEFGSSINLPTE